MPAPSQTLSFETARGHVAACFAADAGLRIGIETEFLVMDERDPARPVPAAESVAAAGTAPLPGGAAITVEPGGQLELSAPPHADIATALAHLESDERELRRRCRTAGLHLVSIGLDPIRTPQWTLDRPRYRAMEQVFRTGGPRATAIATASASIQLNVDAGPDPLRTWRLANHIGPTLLASFANSPFHRRRDTGWKSARQLFWSTVPSRRGEPIDHWHPDGWTDRVLDTDVLCIMHDGDATPGPLGFRFRDWVDEGHPLGYPTMDDLEYHLTTMFPPVRPRGFVELRMIDALPVGGRRVAIAVASTLLLHPGAGKEAIRACQPVAGSWTRASRHGLSDPTLRDSAARCFDIAIAALDDRDLAAECEEWRRRYVTAGRCPADDLLDEGDPDQLGALQPRVAL